MSGIDHDLAGMIDHTLLKTEATPKQVERLCEEARKFGFATVCVNSSYVPLCVSRLEGSPVRVCAVVGFPLGAMATEIKAAEANWAIERGASEIDMVMAVGRLKAGDSVFVREDIAAVRKASEGRALKVILEASLLDEAEKIRGCEIAREAGAEFVKTSTGFGSGGATVEDVRLMRGVIGDTMGVKASGGIRDRATAIRMIEAGATRLGTSASIELVRIDS